MQPEGWIADYSLDAKKKVNQAVNHMLDFSRPHHFRRIVNLVDVNGDGYLFGDIDGRVRISPPS